jgi:hypothetical protein
MRSLWFIAAGGLLLTGCAALPTLSPTLLSQLGGSSLDIHSDTHVRLQEANFVVVKTNLVGQCKGFQLLGLITIVPAEYTKAVSRLYAQAQMQPGQPQTLAHVSVERTSTYFILFAIPKVGVRADLVEFRPPPPGVVRPRHDGDEAKRPQ